jgi:hypothetical protein
MNSVLTVMESVENEEPRPLLAADECCLWWALPTDDQAAVLDAFGLSDPVPATTAMGTAVAIEQRHAFDCERVYVSPGLDGWTLVFGDPTSHYPRDEQRERELQESAVWPLLADDPEMQQRMLTSVSRPSREEQSETLSARFGAAHWYKEVDSYDWGGWGIAENGRFLRGIYRGDYHADVESYGDPQPCEQGLRIESAEQWLREHGFDPGMSDAFMSEVRSEHRDDAGGGLGDAAASNTAWAGLQRRTGIPDEATALRIAARASISPLELGRHTRMTGHGVIALTERGRQSGADPGRRPA